jgi:hypothetical protein
MRTIHSAAEPQTSNRRRRGLLNRLWRPVPRPGLVAAIGGLTGAALLIWSAVIHLHLWAASYRHIPTIGPLFLVQGIAGIVIAAAIVILRRPIVVVGGALFAASTIGGLLISVNVGLFGFQDSLDAPFATQSLFVEAAAVAVLAGTTIRLLVGADDAMSSPSRD